MDWWLAALAFVVIAFGGSELLHAFDVIGDPAAALLAFIDQLRGLLPW